MKDELAHSFDPAGYSEGKGVPSRWMIILFVGVEIIVIVAAAFTWGAPYLSLALVGCAIVVLCAIYPDVWLPLVILGHAVLFIQKTKGISLSEMAFGLLLFGILAWWFVARVVIRKEMILKTSFDKGLVLFLVIATFSAIPTAAHGYKLSIWFRELLVFAGLLLYFPFRECMRTQRGKILLFVSLVLLTIASGIRNVVMYKSKIAAAEYVWEILGTRQTANEPLFVAGILVFVAIWISGKEVWIRIISLALASVLSVFLVLTFSRGYWVALGIGLLIMFFLASRKERFRLIMLASAAGLGSLMLLALLLPNILDALVSTVSQRLFSVFNAMSDRSLVNRLAESKVVIDEIIANPVLGSGLGAEFSFYNILRKASQETHYVHNAYLYLWYKLGILGLLTFLWVFLRKTSDGLAILRNRAVGSLRPFVLAATVILIAMIPVSLTSPQFYHRDSVLIIALCWAFIASAMDQATATPPSAAGSPLQASIA